MTLSRFGFAAISLQLVLATTFGAAFAESASPSDRLFERAEWVFENAEFVHYGHKQVAARRQVKEFSNGRCEASTDCSGFVSYVLSGFPHQYEPIRMLQPDRKYPQAKTYMQFFHSLSLDSPEHGWLRIGKIGDLKRGDVIAWKKPEPKDGVKKRNTGHVAIVIGIHGPVEETDVGGKKIRYQSISVLDSSSVKHFQPELLPPLVSIPHRDGLGKGVVRIVLDKTDNHIGYWEGTYWYEGSKEIMKPTYTDSIAFARLVSTSN